MRLYVRHKVIEAPWFNTSVHFVILCNIFTMAATDYEAAGRGQHSALNEVLTEMEFCWLILFTAEMVVKLYALGGSLYLADAWNRLDGGLVVLGWFDYMPIEFVNVTAFRLCRGLRVLRMVSHNEQVQLLLEVIANAAARSAQAMALLVFACSVFGIIGLQLFNGTTHQRCVAVEGAESAEGAEMPFVWVEQMCSDHYGAGVGAGGVTCAANFTCIVGEATPAKGFHSFDDFPSPPAGGPGRCPSRARRCPNRARGRRRAKSTKFNIENTLLRILRDSHPG